MNVTITTHDEGVTPDDIFDALEAAGYYVAVVTVNGQRLTNGEDD